MKLIQEYLVRQPKNGRKMRDIAEYIQVICISHLPQVATMSDHHLLISKQTTEDRTTTQVKRIRR